MENGEICVVKGRRKGGVWKMLKKDCVFSKKQVFLTGQCKKSVDLWSYYLERGQAVNKIINKVEKRKSQKGTANF